MRNTIGIVKQDSKWEMSAMHEATLTSFPYALGITIVFKPSGIANEHTAQITNVSDSASAKGSTIVKNKSG